MLNYFPTAFLFAFLAGCMQSGVSQSKLKAGPPIVNCASELGISFVPPTLEYEFRLSWDSLDHQDLIGRTTVEGYYSQQRGFSFEADVRLAESESLVHNLPFQLEASPDGLVLHNEAPFVRHLSTNRYSENLKIWIDDVAIEPSQMFSVEGTDPCQRTEISLAME